MSAREQYLEGVRLGYTDPIARAEAAIPAIEAEATAQVLARVAEAVEADLFEDPDNAGYVPAYAHGRNDALNAVLARLAPQATDKPGGTE